MYLLSGFANPTTKTLAQPPKLGNLHGVVVRSRKQNYQLIAIYVTCVKTLALLVEHPKDDRISKKTVG